MENVVLIIDKRKDISDSKWDVFELTEMIDSNVAAPASSRWGGYGDASSGTVIGVKRKDWLCLMPSDVLTLTMTLDECIRQVVNLLKSVCASAEYWVLLHKNVFAEQGMGFSEAEFESKLTIESVKTLRFSHGSESLKFDGLTWNDVVAKGDFEELGKLINGAYWANEYSRVLQQAQMKISILRLLRSGSEAEKHKKCALDLLRQPLAKMRGDIDVSVLVNDGSPDLSALESISDAIDLKLGEVVLW